MSSEQSKRTNTAFGREPDDTPATVQLLVSDVGNRTIIQEMLDEEFDVETSETIGDADMYLIEDQLFSEYQESLRERINRDHPVFCPVVLIRRETTELTDPTQDGEINEGPLLIDEVVDVPVDRSLLLRRLHSVLIRRRQSQQLSNQVSTLETREQELRRFERGVESTGNGILMTNRFGKIDYVNPAFEELTGYAEAEVIDETAESLQPANAAEVFTEEFWRTMVDRGEWAGDVVLEHSDETRSIVDASVTAIHNNDGNVEGFVVVMADITQRIQREEYLQRQEEELERLRQILTRYLRHNLRNNLNVILGYGEMLVSDETLSGSHRQAAEKIVSMAEGLVSKSETARQYSSLIQQDNESSSHDLTEIVVQSVQKIIGEYPNVEFDIDVPDTCEIYARSGIRYAIEELIENAAEHADAGAPTVQIQLENASGARLVIDDNGPGISEMEVESLEEGAETPLSHSQGVGLWLSKWVIESSEGQLSFEHLDPGTRVVVEYPPPQQIGSGKLDIPTLREREQRLQTVIDRMTDAIVEVNASWEVTFMDARAEEILQVSSEEIQGEEFWDVFSGLHETQLEAVVREVMESRTSEHNESYYPGINSWISVYVYPEFDGGLSLYLRDTTKRNEQRQELQQARSRIELALDVTQSTVWEWDTETDSVTTHPEVHTAFGVEISTGDDFLAAIHPGDRERVRDALEATLESEIPYHAEYRVRHDGGIRWVEDYGELRVDEDDDTKRVIGIAREITERKRREQELQRNRTFLERTEAIAGTGGWEVDVATGEQRWTEGTYEIHDLRSDSGFDPTVDAGIDFYHPDDQADISNAVTQCIEHGEPYELELRLISAEDQLKWVRTSGEPVREDGEIVALRGAIQDVTDLKERAQELERARDLFREAETLGAIGAWEIDTDGTLVWTAGTRRIHEVDEDYEPAVEDAIEFYHPEDREDIEQAIDAALEQGEPFERELRITTAQGNQRWIRTRGKVIAEEESPLVRGYVQDITEQKEREREIREARTELESAIAEQERLNEAFDRFLDIATDTSLTLDQQLTELLEHGVEFLNLDIGIISHIDPPEYTVQSVTAPDGMIEPGDRFDLADTFCSLVYEADGPVSFDNPTTGGVERHPAFQELGLESYLGEPLIVDGERYGTLNFSSPDSRNAPFSDGECAYIGALAEWVGKELSRKRQAERFNALFQNSVDSITLTEFVDDVPVIRDVNPAFEDTFGYEKGEAVGRSIDELVVGDDPDSQREADAFNRRIQSGERVVAEVRRQTRDGVKDFVLQSTPLAPGENNEFTFAIYSDITEIKEREQEIAQLNELHSTVLANIRETVLITDDEGRFTYICENVEHIFGYNRDAVADIGTIQGLLGERLVDPDEVAERGEIHNLETTVENQAGESRQLLVTVTAVEIEEGSQLYSIRDITDRVDREKAFEELSRRHELALDATDTGVWEWNIETDEVIWSEALERLLGIGPGEFGGTFEAHAEFLHPEGIETIEQGVDQALSSTGIFDEEFRMIRDDGEVIWVHGQGKHFTDDGPDRMLGITTEITERKEQEQALREERHFIDTALDTLADIFYVGSPEGDFLRWNERLSEVTEYSDAEIERLNAREFFEGDDFDRIQGFFEEVIETGEAVVEAEIVTKDGESIPYSSIGRRLEDSDGELVGIAGISRDISDRKRRERELERTNQQLEEFASVVSHDLRNPLNVIEGRVELAREESDSEHLDAIARAGDRMDELIDDLLTLAREGEEVGEMESVDLASIAGDCWQNVDTDDATLNVETNGSLVADRSQLRQILENLFRNSVEHGGSDVTITVGMSEGTDGFYVEDDGPGISAADRERVFEAGYTTGDEGTGFGLTIVREIAESHDWEVDLVDGRSGGARFEFRGVEPAN